MGKQNADRAEHKKAKRAENPLYVLTDLGYIETGYTEQRVDREVTRGDRLLLELEAVANIAAEADEGAEWFAVVAIRERLEKLLKERAEELKASRTRSSKKR